ncbi:MAG: aminotransferase class V-fold PLP-dependent enzyme [Longimicrobiales bacterium]
MKSMTVGEARAEFPAAEEGVYANVSVNALVPDRTIQAVQAHIAQRASGDLVKAEQLEAVEQCRAQFARLVGAEADEIALIKNVSEGINLVAGAMDWRSGDNVVLCQELEHPSNVFPWHNLARKWGVEVRSVPQDGGRIPVGRLIRALDDRTRLVTVPTVGFSPGFRTDIGELSAACRARGVFLLLDAAQSVGVLHTDVGLLGADALAVATQKGLMSFYGTGFLYVRKGAAETMTPASLGRFGVDFREGGGETTLEEDDFRYAPGARRFDGGNYNYLGLTAVSASMTLLEAVGSKVIEAHVCALAARLAEGMHGLGLPVCGGPAAPDRVHIVTVGEPGAGGHDSAEDPRIQSLYDHLTADGVRLSIRRGVLRLSFHVYNNDADVDRILSSAATWADASSV